MKTGWWTPLFWWLLMQSLFGPVVGIARANRRHEFGHTSRQAQLGPAGALTRSEMPTAVSLTKLKSAVDGSSTSKALQAIPLATTNSDHRDSGQVEQYGQDDAQIRTALITHDHDDHRANVRTWEAPTPASFMSYNREDHPMKLGELGDDEDEDDEYD